jgi:hypothetical protein
MSELEATVGYAGWDIEVVAAGGISPGMAAGIAHSTGCRQVLTGHRRRVNDLTANPHIVDPGYEVIDVEWVAAIAAELQQATDEDEPFHMPASEEEFNAIS